jgi:uncharacterized protein (DUF2062 family)
MGGWFKRKAVDPLLDLLKQGLSPGKLAQCVAFGVAIAVFPALGTTTVIAAGAALAFRLNMVAIQTVNYLAYPLQFVLLLPFFRAGEWLFGAEPLSLGVADVATLVGEHPLDAIGQLWTVTWHAAVAWGALSVVVVPLLTLALTPVFKKAAAKAGLD